MLYQASVKEGRPHTNLNHTEVKYLHKLDVGADGWVGDGSGEA